MVLRATNARGDTILCETYYSIGGGFVQTVAELGQRSSPDTDGPAVPYPIASGAEILRMAARWHG